MSNLAIPAPGGSVSPARFAIMALGAAGGIVVLNAYVGPKLPASLVQWSFGPISGQTFWFGIAALLGGAAASMAYSRFAK
jgi:hypothetical protein